MGLFYGLGAGVGGGIFLWKSVALYCVPTKKAAIANFLASLLQLVSASQIVFGTDFPPGGTSAAVARSPAPGHHAAVPADPRRYRRYKVRVPIELGAAGRIHVLETEDVSQGGCRVVVMFPLRRGELVRIRFRVPAAQQEPSGPATVAWATRDPPYRVGLRFADPLVEQMPALLRALLGPVQLLTQEGQR